MKLFFAQIPSYELLVSISNFHDNYSFVNITSQLKQFVIDGIRTILRNQIVYPNKVTFFLPFAGRDASFHVEQIYNISTSKTDNFIEVTSRFIDEVLQLKKVDLIPNLFDENCKIFGFFPNGKILIGYQGVSELICSFHKCFGGSFLFDVSNLMLEKNHLSFRFFCEGKMLEPIWGRYKENELLNATGVLKLICCYKKRKCFISHIQFFWDLQAVNKLLSLPKEHSI